MLDALARQIFRQRLAAPLLRLRLLRVRQPCLRNRSCLDIIGIFGGGLLSFVEDTLRQLLAAWRVAMQALQAQLLFKMHDALRELLVLGLQRSDLGPACAAMSAFNSSAVAVRFIESLNRNPPTLSRTIYALQQRRRSTPGRSAHTQILPRRMPPHRLDVDALEQPMQLFGR